MRLPMITASLYSRHQSLLSQPQWQAQKRNNAASSLESAIPYLLDTLARLPALYEERDVLTSNWHTRTSEETPGICSSCPASDIASLLNKSRSFLNEIKASYAQWNARHPAEAYPSLPSSASGYSTHPCPFQTVTHFSSLHAANAFTFYHCILILLNQFILSIQHLLTEVDRDLHAETLASEAVYLSALDILRSVDYHLPFTMTASRSMTSDCGPRNFYLLFPLRVAFQALSKADGPGALPYMLWLRDIFAVIRERAMPWASNEYLFKLD